VDASLFQLSEKDDNYFLIVSALVPYKKVQIAIEAFNKTGKKLLVVGTGPESEKLKSLAKNNIKFLGWRDNNELANLYAGCRALIFQALRISG